MSKPSWAVELSATDADAAQLLRLVPGVEARYSQDATTLWLRGADWDPAIAGMVRRLPVRARYSLLEDGRAVPDGGKVPVITLLGSGWVPLRHLTTITPPAAREPGSATEAVPLRLVPATREAPPDVLCLPFQAWHDYAITAPAIRLEPLRFAVSEDARALVHGRPLPPLPGDFYTLSHGIATPSGHTLDPPLHRSLLARHFRLAEGDVLLFHHDGTCELLDAAGFAQASRSAARETAVALAMLMEPAS